MIASTTRPGWLSHRAPPRKQTVRQRAQERTDPSGPAVRARFGFKAPLSRMSECLRSASLIALHNGQNFDRRPKLSRSITPHQRSYSYQKANPARGDRPVIGALPPQQRLFASPSKSSQPFAHLARGLSWERRASTAITSNAYTRAPVTRGGGACGNRGEICNRSRLR
jgi:hypothetical protein